MHKIAITISSVIFLTLLNGCQTASRTFLNKQTVDVSETHIELPDVFKVELAEVRSTGSSVRETVDFKGGMFWYDRYFRGGYLKRTSADLIERVKDFHPKSTSIKKAKLVKLPIGEVHYTTYLNRGNPCFFMLGNIGDRVALRRGQFGSSGLTLAYYCDDIKMINFEETMLSWMRKVRIR